MVEMMEMMGMFGGVFAFWMFMPLIVIGAAVPVLVYVIARWRARNEHPDRPDPQIGLKVAIHLFRVVAFQLSLAAIFLFLLAIISEADTGDTVRIALGVGVPAGGVWFVHRMLAGRTNGNLFPAVQRMFDGWNLIITGIPGFIALIAFFVIAFADMGKGDRKSDILRIVAPYLLTYTSAWVALGFLWFRNAGLTPQGPPAGSATVPPPHHSGYSPHQPEPPPQQQAYPPQPSYPPPGGGGAQGY